MTMSTQKPHRRHLPILGNVCQIPKRCPEKVCKVFLLEFVEQVELLWDRVSFEDSFQLLMFRMTVFETQPLQTNGTLKAPLGLPCGITTQDELFEFGILAKFMSVR